MATRSLERRDESLFSRRAKALARSIIQGPLIMNSDCVGVVVTLRTGVVKMPSGTSNTSSVGSCSLRKTLR